MFAGILLAYVQHHFRDAVRDLLARRAARVAVWSSTIACLILLLSPQGFPDYFWYCVIAWGTLTSVMYVPLLLLLLNRDSALSRWLSAGHFLRIATLGYGIYLWHVPVCEKLVVPAARVMHQGMGMSMLIVWPLALALLLGLAAGIAYVTHVLVEKPALWLRDRMTAAVKGGGGRRTVTGTIDLVFDPNRRSELAALVEKSGDAYLARRIRGQQGNPFRITYDDTSGLCFHFNVIGAPEWVKDRSPSHGFILFWDEDISEVAR